MKYAKFWTLGGHETGASAVYRAAGRMPPNVGLQGTTAPELETTRSHRARALLSGWHWS